MAKSSGNTRQSAPSANPQLKGTGNTEKQTDHPDYNSHSQYKAYLMTHGGMSDEEAERALAEINDWGNSSATAHAYQLGESDQGGFHANTLEDFISRMPKWSGGTSFRGLKGTDVRAAFELIDVGDEYSSKTLASWSSKSEVGDRFSGRKYHPERAVVLVCNKPQNGTSVQNLTGFGESEAEVLCSGKCRYRVAEKHHESDGTLVVVFDPISNGKIRE